MAKQKPNTRHIVKAEGNFEDLPYFTVGNQSKSDGVLEYRAEIKTADGKVLKQIWTVRAPSGLGLPGSLDQDVYVALLQIIDQQGGIPEGGILSFSMYELMQLLGRTVGGRDYQQVKRSLERLNGTMIHSKNAFYVKRTQSFLNDKTFKLLDYAEYSEATDASGRSIERMHVKLSDYFIESYNSDYLKGLDTNFYYSLNSAVAKRLYRFIDKKRNSRLQWEVDLFSLRDRIPLSSNYRYPSKIKEKLDPAHEELIEKGFLESVKINVMPDKSRMVCYRLDENFSRKRPALNLERTPENTIALERLKVEGVWGHVAEKLVSLYGADWCSFCAEKVSFRKGVRDRGPYLRRVIEGHSDPELQEDFSRGSKDGTFPGQAPEDHRVQTSLTLQEENTTDVPGAPDVSREKSPDVKDLRQDPAAQLFWERVLDAFLLEDGSEARGVWFEDTVAISYEDDVLTVLSPNDVARDYLLERFSQALTSTGRRISHHEFELQILSP